jgi:transposase InsO family protein
VTVTALCREVGISRQAVYQGHRHRQRREVDAEAVVALVQRERQRQSRLGVRKLRVVLAEDLEAMGIWLGRDRMFELLRERGLLVERRVGRPRTTDSRHGFRTYGNLLKDLTLTGPHQAWVSDLTYVRTEESWLYVSLVSDAWSRKIVGYAAYDTLEALGSLLALDQALGQLPAGSSVVHHSDRGVQYCCWDYVERLERRGVRVSMTEANHCYENAQAERLNGILKEEYGLGQTWRTKAQARSALAQAVELYNECRPHQSLGYRMPSVVHAEAA